MIAQILPWLGFQKITETFCLIFSNFKELAIKKNLINLESLYAFKTIRFLVIFKDKMLKTISKNSTCSKKIINTRLFSIESWTKITIQIPCTNMKAMLHIKLEFVDTQQINGTQRHIHKFNSLWNLKLLINLKKRWKMLNKKEFCITKMSKHQKDRAALQ